MISTHPPKSQSSASPATDLSSGAGDTSKSNPIEQWLDWLEPLGQEIVSSARILIEVRKDRMRLRIRRAILRSLGVAAVAVGMALWIGSAALATVRGLCGGITAWSGGNVWLGDFVGGIVALAFAAMAATSFAFLVSRREWKLAKVKYEELRSPRADDGS